ALADREARFRALIENSADGIALLDSAGKILYESPSAMNIFGLPMEELIGPNMFDLMHPDDTAQAKIAFGQLLQIAGSSISGVYRFRHADGSWRWIEAAAKNLLADPNISAIVVNYHDITERKKGEEYLRQSEALFRGLFDNVPD